jgi:hypothetical protein
MLQRERRRERPDDGTPGDPADGSGDARQAAETYIHAVDDAISNALSTNSELFNAAIEQENGQ